MSASPPNAGKSAKPTLIMLILLILSENMASSETLANFAPLSRPHIVGGL